jgi:hypothetical protein
MMTIVAVVVIPIPVANAIGVVVTPQVHMDVSAIPFDMTPQVGDLNIEAPDISPVAAICLPISPDAEIVEFALIGANISDVMTHMKVLRLCRNEAYQSTQYGNEAEGRSETKCIVHGRSFLCIHGFRGLCVSELSAGYRLTNENPRRA